MRDVGVTDFKEISDTRVPDTNRGCLLSRTSTLKVDKTDETDIAQCHSLNAEVVDPATHLPR